MRGVKKDEVFLQPHNAGWRLEYEIAKRAIAGVLGENLLEIHHIGSTAIEGIAAKPILDVGVEVASLEAIDIGAMKDIGYICCGEAGVAGGCLFAMVKEDDRQAATQYIHCYPPHHPNLAANIRFRDYLIRHPEYAEQYDQLKAKLQKLYPGDRIKYSDGKAEFIKMVGSLAKSELAHEGFMREAIALALEAEAEDEVPVGCVVTLGGEIIGRGRNRREISRNALAHAEIEAIDEACRNIGSWRLWECELYVTLEPCPMCAGAIINSRIPRVFFGAYDPKGGACGSVIDLFANPFNHFPEVKGGLLESECGGLLTNFFRGLRDRKEKNK